MLLWCPWFSVGLVIHFGGNNIWELKMLSRTTVADVIHGYNKTLVVRLLLLQGVFIRPVGTSFSEFVLNYVYNNKSGKYIRGWPAV